MDRETAVSLWNKTTLGGPITGRAIELFASAIEVVERERCAKLCEAEHVGASLTADDLGPCNEAYNMALQHAAASIRGPNVEANRL